MANSFNFSTPNHNFNQQHEFFDSGFNPSENAERLNSVFGRPPEYSDSIPHKLQQIQNAVGGLQTSKLKRGAHDNDQEFHVLEQINTFCSDILNNDISAEDARQILNKEK